MYSGLAALVWSEKVWTFRPDGQWLWRLSKPGTTLNSGGRSSFSMRFSCQKRQIPKVSEQSNGRLLYCWANRSIGSARTLLHLPILKIYLYSFLRTRNWAPRMMMHGAYWSLAISLYMIWSSPATMQSDKRKGIAFRILSSWPEPSCMWPLRWLSSTAASLSTETWSQQTSCGSSLPRGGNSSIWMVCECLRRWLTWNMLTFTQWFMLPQSWPEQLLMKDPCGCHVAWMFGLRGCVYWKWSCCSRCWSRNFRAVAMTRKMATAWIVFFSGWALRKKLWSLWSKSPNPRKCCSWSLEGCC